MERCEEAPLVCLPPHATDKAAEKHVSEHRVERT